MTIKKVYNYSVEKASILLFFILMFSTIQAQISNNSLQFDGSNYVKVGSNPAFDLQGNTATTFEGWIRFCDDGMIFSKNWCSGQAGYYMNVVNGGQIRVKGINNTLCTTSGLFLLTTTQTYSFNTWHHFAFVVVTTSNTTNVKVYMNGVLVLSDIESGIVHNSTEELVIGAYKSNGGPMALPFKGDMDEFRVYNAALTPAELGLAIPTNPSLVLHYEMEPQINPSATSEPNIGSLGSGYNGNNVILTSPSISTALDYNLTSVYLPIVDLGPDTVLFCGVTTVGLSTIDNSTSYTWQQSNPTGSSWQAISGNNANTLTYNLGNSPTASVIVTGIIGSCTDSDTINITTVSAPGTFLGNDTIICNGSNIVLNASSSPGTYLWQDGSTASTFTTSAAGIYWVEVSINGCVSSDTIIISTANAPSFNLGNDTTICFGQSLLLDASSALGSYLWQNGSTSSSFLVNQNGIYWVTVSNNCGSVTDSLIVDYYPDYSFSLGNDTLLCDGASITLDVSSLPGTYLWQDGSTASTFTTSAAGTYWVEVSINGCVSSDTIIISTANAPSFNLGNDTTICFGQSLLLDASSALGSYLWQNGSTGSSFLVNQNGIYWVTVSNNCGSVTDSLIVDYYTDNSFSLGNDTTICEGSLVEITSNNPSVNFIWQDGSIGASYIASAAGEYSAQLSLNGCLFYDTIQINAISYPQVDLGEDLILCEGKNTAISIQAQNSLIEWSTGSTEPTIVVNSGGTYSVQLISPCGIASDTILVVIEDCICGFYVPNAFTPNDDEFNTSFGPVFDCVLDEYKMEIYNRWGEIVFESHSPYEKWDATYLGKIVQDGVYSYKITYTSIENSIFETIVGHVNVIR